MSASGSLRGLLLLATTNVKRERLRSALILVTVTLASLLFFTSLGALNGIASPVQDMLSRQNASHALIRFDTRVHKPAEVLDWWTSHDRVTEVSAAMAWIQTDGLPVHDGAPFGDSLLLTERPVLDRGLDRIVFLEGEARPYPGPGEIWLTRPLAESGGLQLGDVLEIGTEQGAQPFELTAIVVDPQYSSGFMNPVRAWVAPGELGSIYPPGLLQSVAFGVRLDDVAAIDEIWKSFNERYPGGFSGAHLTYAEVVDSYSFLTRLLALMILVFGVISLLVALFIISSTISGVILANYRTFGVLKAIGYTPGNVNAMFLLQFLVLSLVGVPVGIALGWAATRALIGAMLSSIGAIEAPLNLLMPSLLTLLVVLGLVTLVAAVAGARAGRIKPAPAIRYGAPEASARRRNPVRLQWAKSLPLTLVYGMKNAFSGGRRAFYDTITVTVTAFVLLFSINIYYSMTQTGRNLPFWGMDGSDITVHVSASDFTMQYHTLRDYLSEQDGVQYLAGMSIRDAIELPETEDRSATLVSGHIVEGNLDEMGFINLEGRNPASAGEVGLGVNLARDNGWSVGDTVELSVFGQPTPLTIVGIFQGSSNSGYWYRMTVETARRGDPNFEPDRVALVLEEGADRSAVMDDVEAQLGEVVDVEPSERFVEAQLLQIVSAVGLVVTFLSLIFLLVAAVNIVNSTTMGIHESKRQLGIYSALGYTRNQVRMILVNRSTIIAVFALLLGLAGFALLAQPIMGSLTSGMGMPEFPLFINYPASVMALPALLLLCMASAWFPSAKISRIKARSLIVE